VIEIVLTPAVQALGATAGIVLLVDHTDQQMKIAGSQGYEDVTLTVWQEGPIEDHVLISDILRMQEAQYFEHAGALKKAYPDLESRTGALAAVALGRAMATVRLEARVEERTRQLKEERAAQDAFVAFTEVIGVETDLLTLVRQAITVLEGRFPGASIVYYEEKTISGKRSSGMNRSALS